MLSIGEFSKACGLTVKALRFYHERGVLTPAKVDPHSGYRYYDEHNLETAHVIRALRDLDFSLDDIAQVLENCDDDRDAVAYLENHKRQLAEKLDHYRDLIHKIDRLVTQQQQTREDVAMNQASFEIEERQTEPMLVAGLRMTGRYCDMGKGFGQVARKVGRHIAGKAMCLYYDGEYKEEGADFEPCFPIRKAVEAEGLHVRELPAARCVTLIHRGPYDTLSRSYARALAYAKDKGYELDLPSREVYLKGPGMIFKGNPKKYLTEIQLPIKPT